MELDGIVNSMLLDLGVKPISKKITNLEHTKVPLIKESASDSKLDIILNYLPLLRDYIGKELGVTNLNYPDVKFIDDSNNSQNPLGKTAYYDPSNCTIYLYVTDRYVKDILRSYAHEFIHHFQNLEGRLVDVTTTNTNEDSALNDLEIEAYSKGNILFRNWEDKLKK